MTVSRITRSTSAAGWRCTAVSLLMILHIVSYVVLETAADPVDGVFAMAAVSIAEGAKTATVTFKDGLTAWDPCDVTRPVCITVCVPVANPLTEAISVQVKGEAKAITDATNLPVVDGAPDSSCRALCGCTLFSILEDTDCGALGADGDLKVVVNVNADAAAAITGSAVLASDGSEQPDVTYFMSAFGGPSTCTVSDETKVTALKVTPPVAAKAPKCAETGTYSVWNTKQVTVQASALASKDAFTVSADNRLHLTCGSGPGPSPGDLSTLTSFTSGVSVDGEGDFSVFTVPIATTFSDAATKPDAPYVLTVCLSGYKEAATLELMVKSGGFVVSMREIKKSKDDDDTCFLLTSCDIWAAMSKEKQDTIETLMFKANKKADALKGSTLKGVFGAAVLAKGEGEQSVASRTNVGVSVKTDFKSCHAKTDKEEKGIKKDASAKLPTCGSTGAEGTSVLATFITGIYPKAEDFNPTGTPATYKFNCSGALRGLGINGVVSALALVVLAWQRRRI